MHNMGIRISTGAFRSSPIVSLLAEANEPPLDVRRKQLCLQHFFRQQRIPTSPSTITSNVDFNEDSIIQSVHSIPFGRHVHDLTNSLNIENPRILPTLPASQSPWRLPQVCFCEFKLPRRKKDYPEHVIRGMFRNHQQVYHAQSAHFYTDGSKSSDGVGIGVHAANDDISIKIPSTSSIYTAELLAIEVALEKSMQHSDSTIFTDSMSSIQGLQDIYSKNPIITKLQTDIINLFESGRSVKICWTPSHIQIDGNEKADQLAKVAQTSLNVYETAIPHSDYSAKIKLKVREEWKTRWENLHPSENKLRRIKPKIELWNANFPKRRKLEVVLCRLRIGHTRLTHGHYMAGRSENFCPYCGDIPLSVAHVLCECPQYVEPRSRYFRNTPIDQILGRGCRINSLMNFLCESNLLNKI